LKSLPAATYLMSGYKPAGDRAIRIDMLERLADLVRAQDSRGGFEATPDMLSITGMTLDQLANLMEGLGYKAERGEREKPAKAPAPDAEPKPEVDTTSAEATPEEATAETPADPVEEDTTEVFYTFTWGGNQDRRAKPQGKREGGKPKGKGKPRQSGDRGKPRSFEARPQKKDRIDPDNPFAQALMGLKEKNN
jgi:ATP-dependent RNA helicase SUPV3L1/SUV3